MLLDKLALDKEKQTLEDENRKLKALLKQYLDGEWSLLALQRLCTPLPWFAAVTCAVCDKSICLPCV